jgi:hypothetical protein
MQPIQRVRLSVGLSTPIKLVVSAFAAVFAFGGVVFAAFAWGVGTFGDTVADGLDPSGTPLGDNPFGGEDPFGGQDPFAQAQDGASVFSFMAKAMGLCGLPFVLIGLYMIVYAWRSSAWLDGTVVSKRGAFLTRKADLATADVRMGGIDHTRTHHHGVREYRTVVRIPALVVTDSGRTVKIPLRGQGLDLLPPTELQALAGALSLNTSASAERARAIAAHLNGIAMDPLAA